MIFYFFLVCFTFSISYSMLSFHLVHIFQFLHLFFFNVLSQAFIKHSRKVFVHTYTYVWFQCVCPLMPPCNTYRLTWASLTLDMGYLFMAAPAKRSHCSLSWTRGTSSPPPLLTLDVGLLLSAASLF